MVLKKAEPLNSGWGCPTSFQEAEPSGHMRIHHREGVLHSGRRSDSHFIVW